MDPIVKLLTCEYGVSFLYTMALICCPRVSYSALMYIQENKYEFLFFPRRSSIIDTHSHNRWSSFHAHTYRAFSFFYDK